MDIPNDTEAAIHFLTSTFPMDVFEQRLPPIIMKHQIYTVVEDKTEVDRELVGFLYLLIIKWVFMMDFR